MEIETAELEGYLFENIIAMLFAHVEKTLKRSIKKNNLFLDLKVCNIYQINSFNLTATGKLEHCVL